MALIDTPAESGGRVPPGGWPTPTAAYVHVPFCRHRCGYCNFSVIAGRDDLVDDFLRGIDLELQHLDSPAVQTVFIGGGTPTHLNPDQLTRLLEIVRRRFQIAEHAEFSVEANPEDVTPERIAALADAGVNRISLGVQSFNAAKLRTLQRGHSPATAVAAIRAVAARIANCSVDLIFAAPDETLAQWQDDLATAYALPVRHVSAYALTIEKGTEFWARRRRGTLVESGEANELAMYNAARQAADRAGWEHYEVSNFAAPGHRCRHNIAYWHGRGWYAAGPGAAAFRDGRRNVNHRSPHTYLRRVLAGRCPIAESEPITAEQFARERAAFGIRMLDGIDLAQISRESGFDLVAVTRDFVRRWIDDGWFEADGPTLRLSRQGLLFADSAAAEFLGPAVA